MEQRRLGNSGLYVSEVGIGCNNFGGRMDAEATRAVVDAALEEGITFFDTADVYGGQRSEVLLGQALGRRRDAVIIATKFGMPVGPSLQEKGAMVTGMLSQDEIASVIAGATSPAQVAANARAARGWRLSSEEMDQVAGLIES